MRIHVFTEHYPNTYKPYFDTQFADFLRAGHEVRIVAFGKFDAAVSRRALEHRLPQRTRYVPETLRDLRRFGPELARAMTSPRWTARCCGAVVARAVRTPRQRAGDLARALLCPTESPDLCLVHNLVTAKSFPFLRALYPGAGLALYFHGGEVPAAGTIDERETRRAFAQVERVFTNTEFSRAQAIARGCQAEKVTVCPVGFWVDDYRVPEPRPYRPGGALRLISVGRVSPEKGLLHALDAVAALAGLGVNMRYRIVGAGPQLEEMRARAASLGLREVIDFTGERPHEGVLAALAESDVLLLPSVPTPCWAETQACVVQEAMLLGCAVVASRMGGVPESLAPELHPYLVPPADARALAEAVALLESLPVEALAQLGDAGRRFARERYDVRTLDATLLAVAAPGALLARSA